MEVVKRDGRRVPVMFDKVTARIQKLCYGFDPKEVNPAKITKKVVAGIYDGVHATAIDDLVAETAAFMSTENPGYSRLAARVAVSNLHKQTPKVFSEVVSQLYEAKTNGRPSPLVSRELYDAVVANKEKLNAALLYNRDFEYDYFGYKTLEYAYLKKVDGKLTERPQHMLMRVALGIHGDDADAAIETYDLMSQGFFTHATPTMYNAGTPQPQMSSCFLLDIIDDSIDGIFRTLHRCALISKDAGGIGLSITKIRAQGSYIAGSGGSSNGVVPMLRVFDATARYVDQGGGKRKGAFAVYLEPWHADIFEFLDLKKNHGKEEMRARDLFYALWVPDLFMRRVEANGEWSLFCPERGAGMDDVHGEAFEKLYERYEAEGARASVVSAGRSGKDPRVADGDGHAVHAVQGRGQPQVEPAESGHHPLLQPVHRDPGVHGAGRGRRVQPRLHRTALHDGRRTPRPTSISTTCCARSTREFVATSTASSIATTTPSRRATPTCAIGRSASACRASPTSSRSCACPLRAKRRARSTGHLRDDLLRRARGVVQTRDRRGRVRDASRARPRRRASCNSTCGTARRPRRALDWTGCARASSSTACATRCSSRRCRRRRPRRFWATTSASSRTRATSTRAACWPASFSSSTRTCCAT